MHIKINSILFIFIVIFYLTKQIEIYALLMIFALIHELGHIFAGICLGFKPKSLHIMPFGISVNFNNNLQDYNTKIGKGNLLNLKKLFIAIAGPLTNILIVILCCISKENFASVDNTYIIYANLILGIFNLLPIYPLDGGRIINELAHFVYGRKDALIIVNKISNINLSIITAIASIGILYLKNIAIFFIIVCLWIIVIRENKLYNMKMMIYDKIKSENIK